MSGWLPDSAQILQKIRNGVGEDCDRREEECDQKQRQKLLKQIAEGTGNEETEAGLKWLNERRTAREKRRELRELMEQIIIY